MARTLPPPLPDRERAARRWRVASLAALGAGIAAGAVAVVSEFVELPDGLPWPAIAMMADALFTLLAAGIGTGWTRGLRWHESLGMGFQVLWDGIKAIG
ncbi:hypothetical protein [Demequina maris]|uniref:hypothetical protein n=1 Tax=Demequina maris TaxID=1638982 RepID=UPI00078080D9|nr:hypothetical protein [Demequina maris]